MSSSSSSDSQSLETASSSSSSSAGVSSAKINSVAPDAGVGDETDNRVLPLTAAEICRRRRQLKQQSEVEANFTSRRRDGAGKKRSNQILNEKAQCDDDDDDENDDDDTDDRIRKLEAELEQIESSEESDSDEDGDSLSKSDSSRDSKQDGDLDTKIHLAKKKNVDDDNGIVCLSKVKDERIPSLPVSLLPAARKRVLKNIDKDNEEDDDDDDDSDDHKRKRVKHPATETNTNHGSTNRTRSNGLHAAVQEVLQGYVARSSERLPFYCRVCAKQYNNAVEFHNHKQTPFHQTAVELERKASYCRLCRKQLTSPVQLKEHLMSRPHQERLAMMKAKQGGEVARGAGGGRGHRQQPHSKTNNHSQLAWRHKP